MKSIDKNLFQEAPKIKKRCEEEKEERGKKTKMTKSVEISAKTVEEVCFEGINLLG